MVNKILITILLFATTIASGQYWISDGLGDYGVRYGSFAKTSGPVRYATQAPSPPESC